MFADVRNSHKNYLKDSLYEWFIHMGVGKCGAIKAKIISDSSFCPTQEMWQSIHRMIALPHSLRRGGIQSPACARGNSCRACKASWASRVGTDLLHTDKPPQAHKKGWLPANRLLGAALDLCELPKLAGRPFRSMLAGIGQKCCRVCPGSLVWQGVVFQCLEGFLRWRQPEVPKSFSGDSRGALPAGHKCLWSPVSTEC